MSASILLSTQRARENEDNDITILIGTTVATAIILSMAVIMITVSCILFARRRKSDKEKGEDPNYETVHVEKSFQ